MSSYGLSLCLFVTHESSVRCAEKLLQVTMAKFRHTERTDVSVVRMHPESSEPVIPERFSRFSFSSVCVLLSLKPRSVVELVIGLDMLPVLRKKKVQPLKDIVRQAEDAYDYISIAEINRVYSIESNAITTKATQSVIEFSPEGAPLLSDLQEYDRLSDIPFSNISYTYGPFTPGNNGESLLGNE